ncbi:MAG: dipicolinate synthase subunit DpsA [Oscillospiraceae bacterium]
MNTLKNKVIVIAGGDLRQVALAKKFSQDNKVYCLGLEKTACKNKDTIDNLVISGIMADYIIFPLPISIDDVSVNTPFGKGELLINDVLSLAKSDTIIYGGKISETTKEIFEAKGLYYYDFILKEDFAILNAIPTAEGTVEIAMEETDKTLFGCNILLLGYGRISKVLIPMLKALGANLIVSARKTSDMAWIEASGLPAVHTSNLKDNLKGQTLIINTIPYKILDKEILECVDKSTIIIDLSSKPGGVDFPVAKSLGIKVIWALSLPGKVAPASAGEIIYKTIINCEFERGNSL